MDAYRLHKVSKVLGNVGEEMLKIGSERSERKDQRSKIQDRCYPTSGIIFIIRNSKVKINVV
ncbi:hypothetical protein A33Q_2972 [Indibacter alkaliphilus LW1]|jgi:hypothetical protein|uniref:Uncharacterized protein n=1 Tax=Indibacter alkaliphilus (strain CCUG 57479 / KCTC 22604 / LW1) TaxID=1189612 RepID=S2DF25_INDAL|nr:hypothetical protein A33Q_2972 [Indibacter alkaliphilus LW1]